MIPTRRFPVSFSSLCWMYVFMTPSHDHIFHMFIFLSVCFSPVLRLMGLFCFPLKSFPSISFSIVFALFFRNETPPPSHLYVNFITLHGTAHGRLYR